MHGFTYMTVCRNEKMCLCRSREMLARYFGVGAAPCTASPFHGHERDKNMFGANERVLANTRSLNGSKPSRRCLLTYAKHKDRPPRRTLKLESPAKLALQKEENLARENRGLKAGLTRQCAHDHTVQTPFSKHVFSPLRRAAMPSQVARFGGPCNNIKREMSASRTPSTRLSATEGIPRVFFFLLLFSTNAMHGADLQRKL